MKASSKNRCIFSIFYILLLWGFEKLYAQDTLLAKISNDDMSIKAKLDSIRDRLKKDTVSSELIFFDIDFEQKNAYGCILVKDSQRLKGNKIEIIDNIEHVYPLTKKLIELDSKILNELFSYPDNFMKNFFPMETHSISHDNEVYFFESKW